jgi:membrane-associated phospholipid phosphatase
MADRAGDRVGQRARGHRHPSVRAFSGVAVSGYVAIVALMSAWGLLITDVLQSGPIGRSDVDATSWLADHRTAALDGLTKVVSLSADTIGAISIALVVAVVLGIGRRWQAIAALVTGLVLELLVFLTVNHVVGRPRPDVAQLGSEPSTSSFPSGHTAATMVIYLLVAVVVTASTVRIVWRALAWTAVILLPAAVGFSRVYRGMHNPIDVLAGAVLGIAVLTVALVAVRASKAASEPARQVVVAPGAPEAAVRARVLGATG